jgi:hypothetical protein
LGIFTRRSFSEGGLIWGNLKPAQNKRIFLALPNSKWMHSTNERQYFRDILAFVSFLWPPKVKVCFFAPEFFKPGFGQMRYVCPPINQPQITS